MRVVITENAALPVRRLKAPTCEGPTNCSVDLKHFPFVRRVTQCSGSQSTGHAPKLRATCKCSRTELSNDETMYTSFSFHNSMGTR
jgi:hypothetical protein